MANIDESASGAIQGAAMGSYFGPVGAMVGFIAGGIFGSRSRNKRKREEARVLRENTKQSYGIGEGQYGSISQGRTNAENTYQRDVSAEIARVSAGGRVMSEENRLQMQGRFAYERVQTLDEINIQEEKYQSGPAYKFLQQDYKYMADMAVQQKYSSGSGGQSGGTSITEYKIRTEGVSGESFFTDEQKGNLRSYEYSGGRGNTNNRELFSTYAESVTPSFEEFQASRFGDDEAKAAFEGVMTERIDAANQVYDESLLASLAVDQTKKEQAASRFRR